MVGNDIVDVEGVLFLPLQMRRDEPGGIPGALVADVDGGGFVGFAERFDGRSFLYYAPPDTPADRWVIIALNWLEFLQRLADEGAWFLRPGYVPRGFVASMVR